MSKSNFAIEPVEFRFPQLNVTAKGFLVVEISAEGGHPIYHGADSSATPFPTEALAQVCLEELQSK